MTGSASCRGLGESLTAVRESPVPEQPEHRDKQPFTGGQSASRRPARLSASPEEQPDCFHPLLLCYYTSL